MHNILLRIMIVHRDYRDSSASIIKIFDDRMVFYNPGALYGGITIEQLLSGQYTSKSRNKLIAKIFKEAGLIERYGSGIQRIHRMFRDYGIIEPLFEEIQSGFQVTLYKEKTGQTLQEKGQEILKILRNNPTITIKELSEQQHVSIKTVRNQLEKLKQTGRITRVGPDKGGHWQVNDK